MTFLQLLGIVCPLMAMAGAIISGIVLAKSNHDTRWSSKLGKWGAIGMLFLLFGMLGWIRSIALS
jgi:hypothetical protein